MGRKQNSAKKQKRGNENDDRISKLPDELIIFILSLLNVKEAARTSVLSRRWHQVWTFIPSLNFDPSVVINDLCWVRNRWFLLKGRSKYVNWVNSVLKTHQGSNLDKFRVQFDLDGNHRHHIDAWLKFAIERRVKNLSMDFRNFEGLLDPQYCFPVLGNLSKRLRSGTVGFPHCTSLRALELVAVNINADQIEYFLSNCPFLERVCVIGSSALVNLRVAGASLCLRYLELIHCYGLESLYISATNLISFVFHGPSIKISYENIPNLVEVYFAADFVGPIIKYLLQLSSYVSQIETLELNLFGGMEIDPLCKFPVFANLKKWKLKIHATNNTRTLLDYAPFIHACPALQTFELEIARWNKHNVVMRRAKEVPDPHCPHKNLREVKIVGFTGLAVDNEIATYLIKNAFSLEKIILDTSAPTSVDNRWDHKDPMSIETAVKCAMGLKYRFALGNKLKLR
ncbi:F-box/FBD/LRR-repeat protein At5g53840-like isoform X2 [Tripterygium wilfordii]|uniref:F-box/FBD/LRR-repeat protein At5g53840-like isoform X2 n=1 Tax=Tripterygium wilfordii TaxID=458696 RepID=UPI0018F857D6|nr:F-box/FBD/LRR-repeat protein At5g53840-like isoform X2 [Tripterygium wilfordii]